MLRSLYRRARRAMATALPPYDRQQEPPRRLGCVDIEMYATPRDESEVTFLRRVKELKQHQKQDEALPTALVDYFADRFERLDIRDTVGCQFRVYLKRPLIVEQIRHDLA